MSLFTSLQLAKNSLLTAQIGLQVTANNISNASTPGYLRQEMVPTPAPAYRRGNLLLGLGVQVERIQQQVDKFLEERLRGATSDLAHSETQEKVHLQLEALLGELNDSDVSTALTDFFNSVNEVLNHPESRAVRNLVALQGSSLTLTINRLDERVRSLRSDINDRLAAIPAEINNRLAEIAQLNVQIVAAEGGGAIRSDAVGLRDRRQVLLGELARMTDIQVAEQESGAVSVFAGGEYLVADAHYRSVKADLVYDRGLATVQIKVSETDSPLATSSGEVGGLAAARDQVLGGFLDDLDGFARTLAFEFNKVYSRGQGLLGYDEVVSEAATSDPSRALDQAGFSYTPVSGSFQVLVRNEQTGLTRTTDIAIDLAGLDGDTSLEELAAMLDAIDGLSSEVTLGGQLRIASDSANFAFSFAGDTSGVLAALGINTFFSGDSASSLTVAEVLRTEPGHFAASRGGPGEDVENAVELAALLDSPLESQNGASLALLYSRLAADVTQASAISRSVAEGFRVFQQSLEGEHLAISGVSLDEEAVRMITYQRMYQMSARYIATISDLLETLVNL